MDSDHRAITIVIPTFNETGRLPATLDRLLLSSPELEGRAVYIVVSDDGSTDGTASMVRARVDQRLALVEGPVHRGKGAALAAGMSAAKTPTVVFVDADLPVSAATIGAMVARLERRPAVDLLVGSRRLPGAAFDPPQPLVRRAGGRAFLFAARLLGYRTTSDPQCGVKVLRSDRLREVLAQTISRGFAFDIELIVRARRAGLVVDELPVTWSHVPGSSLRPFRDALATLAELVRLRRRLVPAAGPDRR